MKKHKWLLLMLLFTSVITQAQITDPMITGWWFNTSGNKYNGILTDVETVWYTTTTVYVKSSGIPNYYRDGVTHNDGKDLKATWSIPRVPVPSGSPAGIQGGQEGLMIDGSVFFNPGDAQSYNNAGVWNRLAYYFEGVDMDASNGHSTPTNMYHHHFDNLKLHDFDSSKHSPIVGYAWDGYPIYGPFGYKNADGTGGITRMTSSYSTKSYTTRTNGPLVNTQYPIGCFIEDWQYTAGSGSLDEHNGRVCKTPEYPNGTYAYFTTVDANLKPYYPYFIGPTLYGSFSNTNIGPMGGAASVRGGATQYTPTTSVAQAAAQVDANIEMFPVPVTDYLNIKMTTDKNYTLTLYNLEGKVIDNRKINSSLKLDMSQLTYGVYFVGIHDETTGIGFVKRIMKQ